MTSNTQTGTGSSGRETALSLAAGPLIWALHMSVVYPITSLACEWGWFPFTIAGLPGLQFIQLVATVIAAVIVLVAGLASLRQWRGLRESVPEPEVGLRPFAAFLGVLSNALFLLAIVVAVVPILTLEPCAV